jgi:hypothetical protein
MSSYKTNKIEEKQLGDWKTVSELETYAIVRTAPKGLLGTPMADVLFSYKLKTGQSEKERKRLHLYGEEGAVFKRSLEIIDRKKNHQARGMMYNEFVEKFNTSKFVPLDHTKTQPGNLLIRAIQNRGLTTRAFAEKSGIKAPSLYHHVSGGREISRDLAIEYSEKLNCDPVDLMFEKKSIPIWSKVDLYKYTELEDSYKPGRLFSYKANEADLESVVVPRDIYRSDIKAIKIISRGSMYHNKVAFYYRSENKETNYINQLCVIGCEVPIGPKDFTNDTEERYYFGLYEENKGESNLLNPDPFAKNKYILRDIEPLFIAPIVMVLNPEAVVDQTELKVNIPQEKLIRREEQLTMEIERLKIQMLTEVENRKEAMKYANYQAEMTAKKEKEINAAQEEAQKQMERLTASINDVTKRIEDEMYQEKKSLFATSKSLFDKAITRQSRDKLKVVGGKK